MDFDVPTDLINQSQIGFRESAGLSSFNPNDTTLPSLPAIEASISTLDPSPPYLRCKFCQGKLLRGLQSLICIYCGEYQKNDLHPDPISFNSTNGFTWLLKSLNLNGSEKVGSLSEGSGIHGGQSPAEDNVTVSELLDLQISWRDEPKKHEDSSDNKTSEVTTSPLNLGTTNLDNFFTERVASEEEQVSSKQDESKVLETVTSSIDDSSEWNAEFQFADSKVENENENENSKPVDPFVGGQPDLSVHMDAVFGQIEGFSNKKLNEDKDWVQDDLFANMGPTTFQQAENLESVVQEKDEQKDLFANMDPTNFQQAEQLESVVQVGVSSHVNVLSSKDVDQDWFSDGNWQKSSEAKEENLQKPNELFKESGSVDWFENADWQKSSADKKEDNLFDFKPQIDVVSSPSVAIDNKSLDFDDIKKPDLESVDWFQDSQWSTGAPNATTNIVANKDDDGFDDWNDFTSSTGKQDSFQDSWKQDSWKQSSKENPEVDLFQSTQEVDFGNFSQSDMFSGSFSNKKPDDVEAVYDMFSESSTTSGNVKVEGGNNTPNATTSQENNVQMLMSQMHDLCFMLKSELSVPSKPDDNGPSHS